MGTESDDEGMWELFRPAAPEPEPDPEPDPGPAAEEQAPEPVVDEPLPTTQVETQEPTLPIVLEDDAPVVDGPRPGSARAQIGLALALTALCFAPWFDFRPVIRSSAFGMVAWTTRYLRNLPRRDFDVAMLVPFLALLIPILAVVCVVVALQGRSTRSLAIAAGLVAPVLCVYALAREGGDVFRVLDVGAYLAIACSLALLATGIGLLASRRGRVAVIAGTAALLVAAFVIPAVAQGDVDSELYAAFASDRTTLEPLLFTPDAGVVAAPAPVAPTTSALVTTTVLAPTTTAAAPATTTTAAQVVTPACPGAGPTPAVSSFRAEQVEAGSDTYYIHVRGTVQNRTGTTVRIVRIEVAVRSNGTELRRLSIPANRSLRSDETLEWFSDNETVVSPGAPPSSADVVAVPYSWNDPRLASCPRP